MNVFWVFILKVSQERVVYKIGFYNYTSWVKFQVFIKHKNNADNERTLYVRTQGSTFECDMGPKNLKHFVC